MYSGKSCQAKKKGSYSLRPSSHWPHRSAISPPGPSAVDSKMTTDPASSGTHCISAPYTSFASGQKSASEQWSSWMVSERPAVPPDPAVSTVSDDPVVASSIPSVLLTASAGCSLSGSCAWNRFVIPSRYFDALSRCAMTAMSSWLYVSASRKSDAWAQVDTPSRRAFKTRNRTGFLAAISSHLRSSRRSWIRFRRRGIRPSVGSFGRIFRLRSIHWTRSSKVTTLSRSPPVRAWTPAGSQGARATSLANVRAHAPRRPPRGWEAADLGDG